MIKMSNNIKNASYSWIVTVFPHKHPWTFPESLPLNVKFMCGQLEKCPETGKLHYHVYILLVERQRYSWVQKNVFNGHKVNCEIPRVDTASIKYCCKEDTRVEGPWKLGNDPDKRNPFFNSKRVLNPLLPVKRWAIDGTRAYINI